MRTLACFLVLATVCLAQTFYPTQDTYVSQYAPDSNYGGRGTLALYSNLFNNNTICRSLIQFYLESIPPGTNVTSAILRIYMYNQAGTDFTVEVHQIVNPWSEPVATWNSQPGFDPSVAAALPYQGYTWWQFDIATLVQAWVNDSDINFGCLLKFETEQYPDSLGRVAEFFSKDTTINRTHLVITQVSMTENGENSLARIIINPNPVKKNKRIFIDQLNIEVTEFALYDVSGKLAKQIDLHDQGAIIETKDLVPGVYYLFSEDYQNGSLNAKIVLLD